MPYKDDYGGVHNMDANDPPKKTPTTLYGVIEPCTTSTRWTWAFYNCNGRPRIAVYTDYMTASSATSALRTFARDYLVPGTYVLQSPPKSPRDPR